MSPIKTVAVAGGTGTLGSVVVAELAKAGFSVTALTRDASKAEAKLPSGVTVKQVDYTSVDSLKEALAGQDAVVSVLGTMAVGGQTPLADAAIAAGVKRFIPSEFGVNTRKAIGKPIGGILGAKIKFVDYLDEKAKANPGFSWTGMSIGLFFDFSLKRGWLGYDLKNKTTTIVDSGNEPSQATNLYFVGRAIAAVFNHLDETANRYLEISSFNPSQNEIVRIIEEETGEKWTLKHASSKELQKSGEEKLAKGDFSAFSDFIKAWQYGDGVGTAPVKGEDNKLLGIGHEDVRVTIKQWLAEAAA